MLIDDVSDNYVSKAPLAVSEFANVVREGAKAISGEALLCANLEKGRDDHFWRKSPATPWEPDPFLLDERMLVAKVRGLGPPIVRPILCAGSWHRRWRFTSDGG